MDVKLEVLLRHRLDATSDGLPAGRHGQPHRALHARPRRVRRFIFPTRREVMLRDDAGVSDRPFVPITIDVHSITVDHD